MFFVKISIQHSKLPAVDARLPCVYDEVASGRLGDRGSALSGSRKVRTP